MQSNDLFAKVVLLYFLTNSICILILLELIIFQKPFLSLFIVIFYLCCKINSKIFEKKKKNNEEAKKLGMSSLLLFVSNLQFPKELFERALHHQKLLSILRNLVSLSRFFNGFLDFGIT